MPGITRAQFLRGAFKAPRAPRRPPWSLPEAQFAALCDGCGACIDACRQGIVRAGCGRLPEIDFTRNECDFCGACRDRCPRGALAAPEPWQLAPRIEAACLAHAGVICRSCVESCERRVFGLRPQPGGRLIPLVLREGCSGCGACVARCPAGAVTLYGRETPADRRASA